MDGVIAYAVLPAGAKAKPEALEIGGHVNSEVMFTGTLVQPQYDDLRASPLQADHNARISPHIMSNTIIKLLSP